MSEPTVDLPDTDTIVTFGETVSRRQAAKEQIKQMEVLVEECDKALLEILDANGFKRATWQGYTVSRREGGERRSIDPVKLLEQGVPASAIEAATNITKTKVGISVRKSEQRDEFTEWVREVRIKAGVIDK